MLQEFSKRFILGSIIITLGIIGILFCYSSEYLNYFIDGFLILEKQIEVAALAFVLLVIFTQKSKRK
jgi:hypothetical protein